jgi:hypothetical protein
MPAAERGTAFGRTARSDLNWIFTAQTERMVEKDKHGSHTGPILADRQDTIPEYIGGEYGNDPRTPG